jgi:hypothetical protein
MPFPWDNLITATSTLLAGFGGGAIGAWLHGRTERHRDERVAASAHADRQRDAYAALVTTARLALRNFRQLVFVFESGAPDTPAVSDAVNQTADLSEELNRTAAVTEMLSSPEGRRHAKTIYDRAKACGDLYQSQFLRLAGLHGRRREPFDSAQARVLCDELGSAIDAFIDVIRPDLNLD